MDVCGFEQVGGGQTERQRTSLEWDQDSSFSFTRVFHTSGRGTWIVTGTFHDIRSSQQHTTRIAGLHREVGSLWVTSGGFLEEAPLQPLQQDEVPSLSPGMSR